MRADGTRFLQGHAPVDQPVVKAAAAAAGPALQAVQAKGGPELNGFRDEDGGKKIAAHLDAVYGIFGEALLPWLPLGNLANVIL
jgi:hypothetical protein